jgi:hypothetical protein
MDLPPLEMSLHFNHYQNNWILPEESIISLQPSYFLLDIEAEANKEQETLNNTFLSMIIDEEQSGKVCHLIHG